MYWNSSYEIFFNAKCCIPQGSVLGPLLFLIYINDIVDFDTVLYADCINLHISEKNHKILENMGNNELEHWSLKCWKVNLLGDQGFYECSWEMKSISGFTKVVSSECLTKTRYYQMNAAIELCAETWLKVQILHRSCRTLAGRVFVQIYQFFIFLCKKKW